MTDDCGSELFDAAPVPLVLTSLDGIVLGVNRRFTRETGYTLEDIPTVSDWWRVAYPDPGYREMVKEVWAARVGPALGHGEAIEGGEFTVRRADGSDGIYLMNVQPFKGNILVDLVDISAQKDLAQCLSIREAQVRRHEELAKGVMISPELLEGNVEETLQTITRTGAEGLGVPRASVWLYDENYEYIRCLDVYEADKSRHSSGIEVCCAHFAEYTSAHRRGAVIAAVDVYTDPRTRTIDADYQKENDIRSLLDVPLFFNGRMGGLLSFETTGQMREWNSDDERFALIMASAASLCFEIAERRAAEKTIKALNETLESKVAEQTADLSRANLELQELNTHLESTIEELKETQAVMVMNEKLVSLGRLVAGLSHELNTPLAVINEALSFISENVAGDAAARTQKMAQELEEGELVLIRTLRHSLSAARGKSGPLPLPAEKREARKPVLERYRLAAVPDADEVVDELFDLGLLSCSYDLIPALSGPHAKAFRQVLGSAIGVAKSAALARIAIGRVSDVFAALRAYVTVDSADVPEAFPLEEAVEAIIRLRPDIATRGISLVHDIPPGLKVYAKRAEIGRICYNILSNAILAVATGGRIEIAARQEGQMVRISIRDSGPGIPPEVAERLFEPFFTTRPPGEGAGVGLDIARRLAGANGATIDFSSEAGNTVFNVHIPAAG